MARDAIDLVHFLAALASLELHPNDSKDALAIWLEERGSLQTENESLRRTVASLSGMEAQAKSERDAARRQRDDLAVYREADQATIASLGLVNKELADALIRLRGAYRSLLAEHYSELCDPPLPSIRERLTEDEALRESEIALRNAGRLPKKGVSE
jgi:hypothetical protein